MTSTLRPDLIAFGGTFDPPHIGHVETVRLVTEHFPSARIVVIPAGAPAMAAGDKKTAPIASFAQRFEMCHRAFAKFSGVEVSDIEQELPHPSYTVQTLAALAQKDPRARLGWIMGADQFRAFPRWHEPAKILTLAHLIVLPRGDDNVSAKDVAAVIEEVGATLQGASSPAVTVLAKAPPPYASRLIRQALRRSEINRFEGLPAEVAAYIEDQHLYSDEE